jgi:hypothetical protein
LTRSKRDRRRLIGTGRRQDMYVLAGLPIATHRRGVEFLKTLIPTAIVHSAPSTTSNGTLYPKQLVETFVRMIGNFAVRRRKNGPDQPPAPATITLLYVPSPDAEQLLTAFDFAILAAPLPTLVAYDIRGRQLRHDLDTVQDALASATDVDGELQAARRTIAWRISRYKRSDEGLLLPPRNFLRNEGDLIQVYRSFRRGERGWDDRLDELGPTELTNDDMPKRIENEETRRVFVDVRGMAFPVAHPLAFDGPPRELEPEAAPHHLLSTLRALYRFGGALPRGIHHDAQRANGSALGGATFHCDSVGEISAQGDYANVYPNDFVRPRP